MDSSLIYASGVEDTTGTVNGDPVLRMPVANTFPRTSNTISTPGGVSSAK
jgi:hypothetical protein